MRAPLIIRLIAQQVYRLLSVVLRLMLWYIQCKLSCKISATAWVIPMGMLYEIYGMHGIRKDGDWVMGRTVRLRPLEIEK